MKRIFCLFTALVLIFSAYGCGKNQNEDRKNQQSTIAEENKVNKNEKPVKGGAITIYSYKPDTLCPLASKNKANVRMLNIVYDGLFSVDSNLNINPCLADSYTVSEDNKCYTVKLKKGIKFHDGADFSANDVVFSVETLKQYPDSIYAYNVSKVAAVRAMDEFTVEFKLTKPLFRFAALLDFPVISSNTAVDTASFQPNGTGGYRFENRNEGNLYRLVRAENYRGDEPWLDSINVKLLPDKDSAMYAFSLGEISLCPAEGDDWGKFVDDETSSYMSYAQKSYDFIGFNHLNYLLKEQEIRQVITKVLDREAIFESGAADFGEMAAIPVKESWGLYKKGEGENIDLNGAREILENMGWKLKGGVYKKSDRRKSQALKFDILINEEGYKKEQLAKAIKETLDSFGIAVNIKKLPFEEYNTAIAEKKYDMFIGSIDFSQELDFSFLFGEGNIFGVDDGELFYANEALQSSADKEEYAQRLSELEMLIAEKAPFFGIGFEDQILLYKKSVKGELIPTKTDIFFGVEKLWVK